MIFLKKRLFILIFSISILFFLYSCNINAKNLSDDSKINGISEISSTTQDKTENTADIENLINLIENELTEHELTEKLGEELKYDIYTYDIIQTPMTGEQAVLLVSLILEEKNSDKKIMMKEINKTDTYGEYLFATRKFFDESINVYYTVEFGIKYYDYGDRYEVDTFEKHYYPSNYSDFDHQTNTATYTVYIRPRLIVPMTAGID